MQRLKKFFSSCQHMLRKLLLSDVQQLHKTFVYYVALFKRILLMLLVCFMVTNLIYFVGYSFGLPPLYGITVAELVVGVVTSLALGKILLNRYDPYFDPIIDSSHAFIVTGLGPIVTLCVLWVTQVDNVVDTAEMFGMLLFLMLICNILPASVIAAMLFSATLSFAELPAEYYREEDKWTILTVLASFVVMAITGGVVTFPILLHQMHIGML